MSCAWPNSWLISVIRPLVCRRARSSWSWNSASSKSSRSSVAACSIRRMLVALRQAFREQAVDERDDAAENVGEHRQCELGGEEKDQPVEASARRASRRSVPGFPGRLHQRDHFVDDQLADVECHDRHQRAEQTQDQGRCRQDGARAPDHREERAQIPERPDPLPERSGIRQGCSSWRWSWPGRRSATLAVLSGH